MKIAFSIDALERAISEARQQDPAYEPGRSNSSVETVVIDVPDPLRTMILARIELLRASSRHFTGIGWRSFKICVDGQEQKVSDVDFSQLANGDLLSAFSRVIGNASQPRG